MKYVYSFKEGNKNMKNLLGGKGANLAEMTNLNLPVPRGFTVTTEACTKYYEDGSKLGDEVTEEIMTHIKDLEEITGKKFGSLENPLLVSVRSGARASMPGMMDTVLNLGMNDEVVEALAKKTGNRRFAYDSYRRFIQMFADVVMGFPKSSFERLLDQIKEEKGVTYDTDLTEEDMIHVTERFKKAYVEYAKTDFPQEPVEQLMEAIKAVFRSWNNDRAITYRRLNDIPSSWGTAVNVQEMVYGNSGDDSGTGVAFTRNPATGERVLFGEYLINAQGEDVVAGIRTPQPIATLKDAMPKVYDEFVRIASTLEDHYLDMQDMEFTIEDGHLFMLQTRNGKRTAKAAINIAVDLVNEGKISKEEAVLRVDAKSLDQLLHPGFDEESLKKAKVIASGLAASPGAATGHIYFTAEDVMKAHEDGVEDILLVRLETSPEDIEGMNIARGVLTLRGGMTSHAAVVARGMGTCCVSGCSGLIIDEESKTLTVENGTVYHEGDYLSLDGTTGKVYGEKIMTVEPIISGDFETFMAWADDVRTMEVRANADSPKDALVAMKFGADGIGLCRTEHMFFDEKRIFDMRKMIVASSVEERVEALSHLLPYQKEDFKGLFEAMKGKPVIIRYLDPPLHEFLPKTEGDIKALAVDLGITYETLVERIDSLKEFNPMMGHRGCRLAVTYPEIAKMQTRAVIEAALEVQESGIPVKPEIMIPLVGDKKEFDYVADIVRKTVAEIFEEKNASVIYMVGTMIEIPRAALLADEIAESAEFFSFGTNDLTQLTYGFSRDDASKFLNDYYAKGIFESDPFAHLDPKGVGKLVKQAATLGKSVRPTIELGICGEHGGDPSSIEFCLEAGLDYVSCSPFRVPIARLASSQAAIREKKNR